MNSIEIGKKIKQIREEFNLTQREFADKYNVTYQAVSKWETGKNLPDISLLHDICLDFNINFQDMIGDKINKKKYKILYILIPSIIIIGIILFLIFKKDNSFEFKTISASCKDFEVSGSIAYDSKRSSIYISNIDYCGKEDNIIYKKIECSLLEKNNNTKTEISKEEYNDSITLENYLKTFSIKVDSYDTSCKTYKDNTLYLEIKAYKDDETIKSFEIPLSLDKTCK